MYVYVYICMYSISNKKVLSIIEFLTWAFIYDLGVWALYVSGMYLHVYDSICMYMSVFACICMYMYVYASICLGPLTWVYSFFLGHWLGRIVCIYCRYMHVYACMCMYRYVYVCICKYMNVYWCIGIYIAIQVWKDLVLQCPLAAFMTRYDRNLEAGLWWAWFRSLTRRRQYERNCEPRMALWGILGKLPKAISLSHPWEIAPSSSWAPQAQETPCFTSTPGPWFGQWTTRRLRNEQ